MRDWKKTTERYTRQCFECRKKITAGEEIYVSKIRGEVVSTFYHLSCGAKINDEELTKLRNLISQSFAEVAQIRAKENNPSSFTNQDYQKIKNWQKKLNELSKKNFFDDDFIISDIQDLQKSLQELENICGSVVKSNNCHHKNIRWESYFKRNKDKKAYCLDCNEKQSVEFLKSLQRWYCTSIISWLKYRKLNWLDLYSINQAIYNNFSEMKLGNVDLNSQEEFWEKAKEIENSCYELVKSKGINIDNNSHRERERERERANSTRYLQFRK